MDIQHLKLSDVPEVNSCSSPLVVVSKHLCGAATDLTLRCCISDDSQCSKENNDKESSVLVTAESLMKETAQSLLTANGNHSKNESGVIGIVIALCCHHRVDYRSYVGHSYLSSRGFKPREFWLLRSLSSWATCGFDRKKTEEAEEEEEEEEEMKSDKIDQSKCNESGFSGSENPPADETTDFKKRWEWYYNMTSEERSAVGRRCKRLLDMGRIDFIKKCRPTDNVKLVKYVEASVSLENVLLLVHAKLPN